MKTVSFFLKFLVCFILIAFVSSCTVDEYAFTDDDFPTEIEEFSDTIKVSTRTRVDDKDGD